MSLRERRRLVRLEAYEIYTSPSLDSSYFFDMARSADGVGLTKLAGFLRAFARTQTAAARAESRLGEELSREGFMPGEDEFDVESAALVKRRTRLARRKRKKAGT